MALITYTPLNDGTGIDASDVNAPFSQIFNEFNGNITNENIANATITPSKMVANGNIETFRDESIADYIVGLTGCLWTTSAGLIGAMSGGTVYIDGVRIVVAAVVSKTFTASKDTYVDIDGSGTVQYSEVANGAAAPALSAGRLRLAKVVTSGSAITSIVKDGFDSIGNIFGNRNPYGANMVYFPSLQNGWVVYDTSTYGPAYYYKDKTGRVQAHGLIRSGTATSGTVLFTMPVGFRPVNLYGTSSRIIFTTSSTDAHARLDIDGNGSVIAMAGVNSSWVSLTGLNFLAHGA